MQCVTEEEEIMFNLHLTLLDSDFVSGLHSVIKLSQEYALLVVSVGSIVFCRVALPHVADQLDQSERSHFT